MKKLLLVILAGLLVIACSDSKNEVSDDEIGLRKGDLQNEQDASLPQYQYTEAMAGESERIERAFENAPPMIPHSIEDMLPITQDNNACLSCHDPAVAADIGAVSVPASHTYDLRHNKTLSEVSHTRFNCVLCHTPQANVAPVIANTFNPSFRTQEGKSASNLLDVLNEGVK